MKPRRIFCAARLSVPFATAIAAFTAQTASAVPYNWTGAHNGTWNTAGNWSGNTIPLIGDALTILGPNNVAGALNINFNANNSANSLIFTNTAATSITNTTSGANRTLTLGSGGIHYRNGSCSNRRKHRKPSCKHRSECQPDMERRRWRINRV